MWPTPILCATPTVSAACLASRHVPKTASHLGIRQNLIYRARQESLNLLYVVYQNSELSLVGDSMSPILYTLLISIEQRSFSLLITYDINHPPTSPRKVYENRAETGHQQNKPRNTLRISLLRFVRNMQGIPRLSHLAEAFGVPMPPELHLTACFSPNGDATGQRVTC